MKHRSLLAWVTLLLLLLANGTARATSPFWDGEMEPFVDPLPIPPRIVVPRGGRAELTIPLTQTKMKYHRNLPETVVWGYGGSSPGPTIEVERGTRLSVHWKNELPTSHLFPRDEGMMMPGHSHAEPSLPAVRSVTHLHGAVVTEPDPMNRSRNNDGWPDAWNVPGEEQLAEYPNEQSARTLWYHDHAMGSTARNVYAGLAGMYLIHDSYERSLNLPKGDFEIPLFIQSRGFNDDGSLFYPSSGNNEFYGNALTVNGKVWPYLDVEPRKYRFRVVNASNARTVALKLVGYPSGESGPAIHQIASDSGFLPEPVLLNDPKDPQSPRLELAPGERGDVIIDFAGEEGKSLLLHNNSVTDPGEGEVSLPGVLLFRVTQKLSSPDTSQLPARLRPIERLRAEDAARTRRISLSQVPMADGSPMLLLNGKHWHDPVEERPVLGTTEIWEVVNPLKDMHPFHIHLVEFQVLERAPIDWEEYLQSGKVVRTGSSLPPDPSESGWKDTVRIHPRSLNRIIIRFAPYAGHYVYHCHILEHEDMDMMRPFDVVEPSRP